MAKGNMFLGMARGKVGDVVFYRADGQQLSRVRNRNPRNPRSNAQLFQRAIMATVVQAYTAGKAIFDHSFQGYSVGAQNQREFLKRNTKMLRELVAADINTPIATNDQKARVVAPGSSVPVANPFIISSGSYTQSLFTYSPEDVSYSLPLPEENETVAQYAARVGLIAGDIYTFVMFAEKKSVAYQSNVYDDVLASLNHCAFAYCRFIVKSGLSDNTDPIQNYSQIFTVQSSGGDFNQTDERMADEEIQFHMVIQKFITDNIRSYTFKGAIGVIRSRLDQDLRSDSVMNVAYGENAGDMFGIASDYLLDTWKAGTVAIGDSDLILEGGEG